MTIRITPTHLADGRELFYFDDSPPYAEGRLTRRLDDPRPLADRSAPFKDPLTGQLTKPTGPQMRLDRLTGEWIPMASHRMDRTFLPAADSCPLCPARPAPAEPAPAEPGTTAQAVQDGEIPDTDYDVVVFENRFPSYWRAPDQGIHTAQEDEAGLWRSRPAAGRCEVVCFSSQHGAALADLPETRIRTIIEAWAVRTEALQATDGIAQVYPFENRGAEIGVTLSHPHGQIYGYPNTTPKTGAMVRQAAAYHRQTGRHLLPDLVAAEATGPRLVAQSQHWLAYVPYAARWPVEMHLAPRKDRPDLPSLSPAERDDLAAIYQRLLRGLDRFFVDADGAPIPLPYIAGWHQAPVDPTLRPLGRLHLQFFSIRRAPGKLKYLAGSESGMGAWISDTTPERIADRLRAALAEADANTAADAAPQSNTGIGTQAGPAADAATNADAAAGRTAS
jgi:UDPglucose--hexose-1-phosphate uridylyltransferase